MIFYSNYFQAFQTAVFYKKNIFKMIKCIFFSHLSRPPVVLQLKQKKIKAREKLSVEKWFQIFDRMNCLSLGIRQRLQIISCFWYFLLYFFCALEAPFTLFF